MPQVEQGAPLEMAAKLRDPRAAMMVESSGFT